ncbi:MAG: DNA-3-methyladenine glycosylase [Halobacteria archaeon]
MAANHAAAVRHLKAADPVLAGIVRKVGPCRLPAPRPGPKAVFESLVMAILHQQLTATSAGAIYRKFKALYPRYPGPAEVLATPDSRLRGAGVSPPKAGYLKDLSAKVEEGAVNLRGLGRLSDEEVVETLTQVRGVGRWTAEMVLIFTLGRPDVLPVGDYGLQKAVREAYGLRSLPKPEKFRRLAEPWRPWRSVASWYLWASQGPWPG